MSKFQPQALIALFFLLFFSLPVAQAAVLEDLYRVEVVGDADTSREQLQRKATEVMLTRLAGAELDMSAPAIERAMQDPRQLMRRVGSRSESGQMQLEFEPGLLRDLLAEAELPLLGRNRPGVLLWAVVSGPMGDELLAPGSDWAEALRQAAHYRGVALLLPLGDLEDRVALSEADIRRGEAEALIAASERYAAEGLLAVTLDPADDDWQLSWQFWLDDSHQQQRQGAATQAEQADQLMLAVANGVHARYAVVPASRESGESQEWRLVVRGVEGLQTYASLQRSLAQLGAQSSLQLLGIADDTLTLALAFAGEREQLLRLLSLDQRLYPASAPESPAEPVSAGDLELPADGDLPTAEALAMQREALEEAVAMAAQQRERTLYFDWR